MRLFRATSISFRNVTFVNIKVIKQSVFETCEVDGCGLKFISVKSELLRDEAVLHFLVSKMVPHMSTILRVRQTRMVLSESLKDQVRT